MKESVRFSVIGFGYWGPNHCRIIQHHKNAELKVICDQDPHRLNMAAELYPYAERTSDIDKALDDSVDAVILATPVSTHAKLVKKALEKGKHVLCEKPLARSVKEIMELEEVSVQAGKKLMCAHVFEFNPVIRYIKKYLEENDIGQYLYLSAFRNGLGPIRKDINVIYDLATHDISIILFLMQKMPLFVSAVGTSCFQNGIEDIAFIHLEFEDKLFASIQVSWLDPIKERKLRIVGSKKMLLFNDISIDEKLKIVKTGESYLTFDGDFGIFQSVIKDGDIFIPNIVFEEPLAVQFAHFMDLLQHDAHPFLSLENPKNVVRVLEALNDSIKNNGERIKL
jgi:predicted dehydrogenase